MMRILLFAGLWLVLTEADPGAMPVGALAALAAAWTSKHLLPPQPGRLRLMALLRFTWHFLKLSVYSGIDVAYRALHPRLPLDPALVGVRVTLPPGMARTTLASELSLLPGTLAVSQDGDEVVLHCLDQTQPIEQQVSTEGTLITSILGDGPDAGGTRHV